MEKDAKNIELKIYKKLYQINSSILRTIMHNSLSRFEYRDRLDVDAAEKEKRDIQLIESIAKKDKWDYHGICSKEDIKLMEFLEYLIDDKRI
jgi:hypothetical protein